MISYTIFKMTPDDLRELIREEIKSVIKSNSIDHAQKDELINTKQACKLLGVSQPTLRKLRKENIVNTKRYGHTLRYSKNEIMQVLKKH